MRIPGHGDVTAVEDSGPAVEGVCRQWYVVPAAVITGQI